MKKILVSSPDYKVVNDVMWKIIIHCNKNKIPLKRIHWGNLYIKTTNCNMKFCLDKEVKKLLKRAEYDQTFKSSEIDILLKYIKEAETIVKAVLKKGV